MLILLTVEKQRRQHHLPRSLRTTLKQRKDLGKLSDWPRNSWRSWTSRRAWTRWSSVLRQPFREPRDANAIFICGITLTRWSFRLFFRKIYTFSISRWSFLILTGRSPSLMCWVTCFPSLGGTGLSRAWPTSTPRSGTTATRSSTSAPEPSARPLSPKTISSRWSRVTCVSRTVLSFSILILLSTPSNGKSSIEILRNSKYDAWRTYSLCSMERIPSSLDTETGQTWGSIVQIESKT